ncbi:DUF4190 domain-containing protein [Lysinibacillus xylanilyticus]|uniref:DUF4190 domain-containing protein n=1 Tax=Lysinibacillus xylanilyticus TaxID=582475 RepID=UPI0037F61D8A
MVENAQTNSNSVISLTLGILSILIPFIGLFLGGIGVVVARKATKEIVEKNQSGIGLATSGLICSVVGIIIQIFAVFSILVFYSLRIVG